MKTPTFRAKLQCVDNSRWVGSAQTARSGLRRGEASGGAWVVRAGETPRPNFPGRAGCPAYVAAATSAWRRPEPAVRTENITYPWIRDPGFQTQDSSLTQDMERLLSIQCNGHLEILK